MCDRFGKKNINSIKKQHDQRKKMVTRIAFSASMFVQLHVS